MNPRIQKLLLTFILVVSAVALYFGWKTFYFLTDDAFIAFRYVSNSILGHGYVWNPPPFRPVEGYTSFLWVVILDVVWRVFGIKPPDSANTIALIFAYMNLIVVALFIMRMQLNKYLKGYRLLLVFTVLLGIVGNPTFLTWASSGLETALFNFLITCWVLIGLSGRKFDGFWVLALTLTASLSLLARPDGILLLISTLILIAARFYIWYREGNFRISHLLYISPILIPIAHQIWRLSFYGEWLPNTYYAKYVAPWPEAGVRYLASFILEYSLWVWIITLAAIIITRIKRPKIYRDRANSTFSRKIHKYFSDCDIDSLALLTKYLIPATIVLHFIYYTLIIGGDHFEWRVYSHLIPLIFLSFLWMLNTLRLKPESALIIFIIFILLSFPVPWIHWYKTKDLNTREETYYLKMPVSGSIPSFLRWYAHSWENLQGWLIDHSICARRQAHENFYKYQTEYFPPRSIGEKYNTSEICVYANSAVGVPGWVFPHVNIIDMKGLNDYVIARYKTPSNKFRRMAHERQPPPSYVESFRVNLVFLEPREARLVRREKELTPEMIVALEKYWENRIKQGIDASEAANDIGDPGADSVPGN